MELISCKEMFDIIKKLGKKYMKFNDFRIFIGHYHESFAKKIFL